MDGAGNSLDRSILLASLLEAGKVRARLRRTQLSREQAEAVWLELQRTPLRPRSAPVDQSGAVLTLADGYAVKAGLTPKSLRDQIRETDDRSRRLGDAVSTRVAAQTAALAKRLGHGASTTPDAEKSEEIEALRDHWWVQWQNGSDWIDLDPGLAKAGDIAAAAQETFEPDKIPADLHHEVQIRVIVEQWDGSKFVEARPFAYAVRPSELAGESLIVRHVPMTWPKGAGLPPAADAVPRFRAAVLNEKEWLPIMTIGGRTIRQSSFTETGGINTRPGSALTGAAVPAAGILDAFGGGEDPKPAMLTAEWIEYEIRAPGQPSRNIRREIFDLAGPSARAMRRAPESLTDARRLSRGLSLLGETEILVCGFQWSPAFAARQASTSIAANQPVLEALASASTPPTGKALTDQLARLPPVPGPLHDLALARAAWQSSRQGIYFRQGNILSRHTSLVARPDGRLAFELAFEIVANDVAVSPAGQPDRFLARLGQGVLDANAEAALAGGRVEGGGTAALFGIGTTAAQWVVVRSDRDLDQTGLSPDARARIETDLRAGYVILAPKAADVGSARAAWWRIDPRTGSVTSIGDRGWGQAINENIVMVFQVGLMGLCFLLAGLDPNGLTLKDGLVCVCAASAAAAAPWALVPGAAGLASMFGALSTVLATGIWLNESSSLNRRIW